MRRKRNSWRDKRSDSVSNGATEKPALRPCAHDLALTFSIYVARLNRDGRRMPTPTRKHFNCRYRQSCPATPGAGITRNATFPGICIFHSHSISSGVQPINPPQQQEDEKLHACAQVTGLLRPALKRHRPPKQGKEDTSGQQKDFSGHQSLGATQSRCVCANLMKALHTRQAPEERKSPERT